MSWRYQKSQRQIAIENGHEVLDERVHFRCSGEFKDRIEQAASDCGGMSLADWLREVVGAGLEMHEEREAQIMAGIEIDDEMDDPDAVEAGPAPMMVESPDEYAERVEADAAAAREQIHDAKRVTPRAKGPAEPTNPRDCGHPAPWPAGRCRLCGLPMRARRLSTSRGTGRYVGGPR